MNADFGNVSLLVSKQEADKIWKRIETIEKMCITPQMFGAVGDGLTDDTAAFQAMIDVMQASMIQQMSDNGDGTLYYGSNIECYIPHGEYLITSVNISTGYIRIVGDNAIIRSESEKVFNITNGWYTEIEGIIFVECDNPIYIDGLNIEMGQLLITRCKFINCLGASIDIPYKQSYTALVKNSEFFKSEYVLDSTGCDLFRFENCWFEERTRTKDYDASFIVAGLDCELQMAGCLWVPAPTTAIEPTVIDASCSAVLIDGVHFGGEAGSKPIVRIHKDAMRCQIKNCNFAYAAHNYAYILLESKFEMIAVENMYSAIDNTIPVRWSARAVKSDILPLDPNAQLILRDIHNYNGKPVSMQALIPEELLSYFSGDRELIYIPTEKLLRTAADSGGIRVTSDYVGKGAITIEPVMPKLRCMIRDANTGNNHICIIYLCPVISADHITYEIETIGADKNAFDIIYGDGTLNYQPYLSDIDVTIIPTGSWYDLELLTQEITSEIDVPRKIYTLPPT